MKFLLTLLILMSALYIWGQELVAYKDLIVIDDSFKIVKNCNEEFKTIDVSNLWTDAQENHRFGFIGPTYTRLQVQFLSLIKNNEIPNQYLVYGKSKVSGTVCEFQGLIEIREGYYLHSNEYFNEHSGILAGTYKFFEKADTTHTGVFEGKFVTYWQKDSFGELMLMDFPFEGNNLFQGIWTDYKSGQSLIANWGEHRIPNSGDLDIGTSEFGVNKKYQEFGWDSFIKANGGGYSPEITTKARKKEEENWWKN